MNAKQRRWRYNQVKHQRERKRDAYLMIKKSCHDSQTLPLRPWGWFGAFSVDSHRKIFSFYKQQPLITSVLPMSGGGFNSGGDTVKKGRKIMGNAGASKPPAAKKPRTCGICNMPGHTRVTCPQRWQGIKDPNCEAALELRGVIEVCDSTMTSHVFQVFSNWDCQYVFTRSSGTLPLLFTPNLWPTDQRHFVPNGNRNYFSIEALDSSTLQTFFRFSHLILMVHAHDC